jgi:CheY-like chemotaxis protein
MGGTIGVVSTPGEGSIFHFTARFELGQRAPVADEGPPEGLPVLVAVDNPAERARLVELLGQWRMHPIAAPDAPRPRTGARRRRPPLPGRAISTQLPDTEGFQLAEAIRGAKAAPPCIIMLAGEGRRGDGARCRELGIAAYLPMPALPSDLLNAILLSVEPIPRTSTNAPSSPATACASSAASCACCWPRTTPSTAPSPCACSASSVTRSRWPTTARKPSACTPAASSTSS